MTQVGPTKSRHLWQVLRYVIVGGVNTLLYMAVVYLLLAGLNLGGALAATIAYVWSVVFYYVAHRIFTFRSDASLRREIIRLVPATAVNYLISLGVIELLSRGFRLDAGKVAILAGIVTAVTGYLLTSLWIFAAPRSEA